MGFPRLALGLGWVGATVAAGVIGGPAWALVGLGGLATAAVTSNKLRALTLGFSLAASLAFIGYGLATLSQWSVVLVVAGLVTGALSQRARTMSR